jgi:hypothetical protein
MPLDKKEKPGPATASSQLNKAREAFEAYRSRMKGKESAAEGRIGAAGHHPTENQFPFNYSGPVPMPFMGQPPQPGIPFPPFPPQSQAGGPFQMPSIPGVEPEFFSNFGKMLNLGVAFATSAFAGGLQVMQGFMGQGQSGHCGPHHEGGNYNHAGECDCCGPCDDVPHRGHDDCGCNPGVHNCHSC